MLGGGDRDARRTERYLDGLMDADERRVEGAPVDMDLDPAVLLAARELRASLVRVHPSFRFEEALAARLAAAARRKGGSGAGIAAPEIVVREIVIATPEATSLPALAGSGAPSGARRGWTRPARPLVVGGVGVASAAISLGAVYVAWRWSRASRLPMVRVARASRSGRSHTSGPGRRAGVLHGILG